MLPTGFSRAHEIAGLGLQGLNRQRQNRTRNPDRTDHLPAEIVHGHGGTPHFIVKLSVVNRNSRPTDVLKFTPQALRIGDRF